MAESDLMYWRVHSACSPALVIFCPGLRPGACYFCPGLRALSSRRLPFLSGIACAPKEVPLGCTRLRLFQQPASTCN